MKILVWDWMLLILKRQTLNVGISYNGLCCTWNALQVRYMIFITILFNIFICCTDQCLGKGFHLYPFPLKFKY